MFRKLLPIAAVALVVGCVQPPAPAVRHQIVYGNAVQAPTNAAGIAVQAAQNAITEAAKSGCKAISIGSGEGLSNEGAAANVVVLLECPATAPNLVAATGAAAP